MNHFSTSKKNPSKAMGSLRLGAAWEETPAAARRTRRARQQQRGEDARLGDARLNQRVMLTRPPPHARTAGTRPMPCRRRAESARPPARRIGVMADERDVCEPAELLDLAEHRQVRVAFSGSRAPVVSSRQQVRIGIDDRVFT